MPKKKCIRCNYILIGTRPFESMGVRKIMKLYRCSKCGHERYTAKKA